MGSVYKQPETEEDNSCHSWREPSKWKGVSRGVISNSKGNERCAVYICDCSVCVNATDS
jgi:hypothetical protein